MGQASRAGRHRFVAWSLNLASLIRMLNPRPNRVRVCTKAGNDASLLPVNLAGSLLNGVVAIGGRTVVSYHPLAIIGTGIIGAVCSQDGNRVLIATGRIDGQDHATGVELAFIVARLFFRHPHRRQSAREPASRRPQDGPTEGSARMPPAMAGPRPGISRDA